MIFCPQSSRPQRCLANCRSVGQLCGWNTMQPGGEDQEVVHAHIAIQRRVFRQETETGFGQIGARARSIAQTSDPPAAGPQRHLQHSAAWVLLPAPL